MRACGDFYCIQVSIFQLSYSLTFSYFHAYNCNVQADPYLLGVIIPMQDELPKSSSKVSSKVVEVREAIYSLNSLEIKLKVSLCFCTHVACKCTFVKMCTHAYVHKVMGILLLSTRKCLDDHPCTKLKLRKVEKKLCILNIFLFSFSFSFSTFLRMIFLRIKHS